MNQVAGNIFDMLLGFDPVALNGSQSTAGANATGQQDGQPFDAILMSLLGTSVAMGHTNGAGDLPLLNLLGGQPSNQKADGTSMNAQPVDVLLQQLMLATEDVENVQPAGSEPMVDTTGAVAENNKGPVTLNTVIPQKPEITLSDDIRQFLSLPNQQIAFAQTQVAPPANANGLYRVINAKVEGDVVRLDLVGANEDNKGAIQITLPKEQLSDLLSTLAAGSQKRIPISGIPSQMTQNTPSLDTLLQKLNFVELKIVEPQTAAAQSAKQVEISATINNQTSAPAPLLTLTVDRRLLEPEKTAKAEDSAKISVKKDSGDALLLKEAPTIVKIAPPRDVPTLAERMQKAVSDGLDRLMQNPAEDKQSAGKVETHDLSHLGFMTDRGISPGSTNQQIMKSAPVRFTLPENLNSLLRPNGEAVSLKIEPDHLGPARLYIEMKNGMLHARVTVESPAAHHAVESSLDNLVEQLQQQNIRVDRIEVTLQNNDGRHPFFDRRSQHPRFKSTSNGHSDEQEEVLVAMSGVAAKTAAPSYISSRGLNLYA